MKSKKKNHVTNTHWKVSQTCNYIISGKKLKIVFEVEDVQSRNEQEMGEGQTDNLNKHPIRMTRDPAI